MSGAKWANGTIITMKTATSCRGTAQRAWTCADRFAGLWRISWTLIQRNARWTRSRESAKCVEGPRRTRATRREDDAVAIWCVKILTGFFLNKNTRGFLYARCLNFSIFYCIIKRVLLYVYLYRVKIFIIINTFFIIRVYPFIFICNRKYLVIKW